MADEDNAPVAAEKAEANNKKRKAEEEGDDGAAPADEKKEKKRKARGDGKKAGKGRRGPVCPLNKEDFETHAKALDVVVAGVALQANPKIFTSGSFGWNSSSKKTFEVDGKQLQCSVTLNITVAGSKPKKAAGSPKPRKRAKKGGDDDDGGDGGDGGADDGGDAAPDAVTADGDD